MWHLVEDFIPTVLWVMLWPAPRIINSRFFHPFLSFSSVVTETHSSHLKTTVSALSQLISLFHSTCLSAFPIPASLHPSCCPPPNQYHHQQHHCCRPCPPGPATTLVFPKSSAIRHLQWINYTVLARLDWASNICTPPCQTPGAPSSPPPTYRP